MENNGTNIELINELNKLKHDRKQFESMMEAHRINLSNELKNGAGREMLDILEGKTRVKMPLKMKIKYIINNVINKIFKTF